MEGSVTASFQDSSSFLLNDVRCFASVYERYSWLSSDRASVTVMLLGDRNDLRLSIIAADGSQARFVKINTWSEQTFADKIAKIVGNWKINSP